MTDQRGTTLDQPLVPVAQGLRRGDTPERRRWVLFERRERAEPGPIVSPTDTASAEFMRAAVRAGKAMQLRRFSENVWGYPV